MSGSNPQPMRTEHGIHIFVGSLFCAFCFCHLWLVQGGTLAVAQHILSHGQTVYHYHIGAIVLTTALLLIQWVLNKVTRLRGKWFALSFFPSFLLLSHVGSL